MLDVTISKLNLKMDEGISGSTWHTNVTFLYITIQEIIYTIMLPTVLIFIWHEKIMIEDTHRLKVSTFPKKKPVLHATASVPNAVLARFFSRCPYIGTLSLKSCPDDMNYNTGNA